MLAIGEGAVALPKDVQSIIDRNIASGRFPTNEAVIAEAVRHWDTESIPDDVLEEARIEARRGEGRPLTREVMTELLQRARAQAQRGHLVREEVRY